MKNSRFSEHQIIKILKEVAAGRTAKEVCREYGIINAMYYAVAKISDHFSVHKDCQRALSFCCDNVTESPVLL